MLIFRLILVVFTSTSVLFASAGCNCTGEARVMERNEIDVSHYGFPVRDSRRDKFERIIHWFPETLKCEGHSCCASADTNPAFLESPDSPDINMYVGGYWSSPVFK